MILPAVLLLSGCATYVWVHPEKSNEQRDQESYTCEKEAAQAYPTLVVSTLDSPGHYLPPVTECTDSATQHTCITRPGRWVPPSTSTTDVNRSNREALFASCMRAKGWRRIRVD